MLAGSGGGGPGRSGLEDGVHSVRQGADTVDAVCVLCSKFDLAIVGPDGGRPRVFCEGAHVGEVGGGQIFIDGEGVAISLGDGIE